MNTANILLLSSSRSGSTDYLEHALSFIAHAIQAVPGKRRALFIPYAGVTVSADAYTAQVQTALQALDIEIEGIHNCADPQQALAAADIVLVGGGNTFRLVERLHHYQLIAPLQQHVAAGKPYIGWSAGANIAGLSIATSNDMPIIEPPSFAGLNIVPLQINPHYLNHQVVGHNGETRLQRIEEFLALNPQQPVLALPEGTAIHVHQGHYQILGAEGKEIYWFRHQQAAVTLPVGKTLDPLLK